MNTNLLRLAALGFFFTCSAPLSLRAQVFERDTTVTGPRGNSVTRDIRVERNGPMIDRQVTIRRPGGTITRNTEVFAPAAAAASTARARTGAGADSSRARRSSARRWPSGSGCRPSTCSSVAEAPAVAAPPPVTVYNPPVPYPLSTAAANGADGPAGDAPAPADARAADDGRRPGGRVDRQALEHPRPHPARGGDHPGQVRRRPRRAAPDRQARARLRQGSPHGRRVGPRRDRRPAGRGAAGDRPPVRQAGRRPRRRGQVARAHAARGPARGAGLAPRQAPAHNSAADAYGYPTRRTPATSSAPRTITSTPGAGTDLEPLPQYTPSTPSSDDIPPPDPTPSSRGTSPR